MGSIALAYRFIRYTSPSQPITTPTFGALLRRLDVLGCVLLAGWLGPILLAISLVTNSTTGYPTWSSPLTVGLFIMSGIILIGFLLWELRVVKYPVVPFELLNRRTPVAVAVNNFVLSVGYFAHVRFVLSVINQIIDVSSCTPYHCSTPQSASCLRPMRVSTSSQSVSLAVSARLVVASSSAALAKCTRSSSAVR